MTSIEEIKRDILSNLKIISTMKVINFDFVDATRRDTNFHENQIKKILETLPDESISELLDSLILDSIKNVSNNPGNYIIPIPQSFLINLFEYILTVKPSLIEMIKDKILNFFIERIEDIRYIDETNYDESFYRNPYANDEEKAAAYQAYQVSEYFNKCHQYIHGIQCSLKNDPNEVFLNKWYKINLSRGIERLQNPVLLYACKNLDELRDDFRIRLNNLNDHEVIPISPNFRDIEEFEKCKAEADRYRALFQILKKITVIDRLVGRLNAGVDEDGEPVTFTDEDFTEFLIFDEFLNDLLFEPEMNKIREINEQLDGPNPDFETAILEFEQSLKSILKLMHLDSNPILK